MIEALHAFGALLAAAAGIFSTWAGLRSLRIRAKDRREQREALVRAGENKDLTEKLNSIPPLAGIVLLLLGGCLGLVSAVLVARTGQVLSVEEARKKCDKSTCKPPSYCVGDVCESAAMPHPAGAKPKAKMPTQRAENLTVHEPSSWGLDVRPAWADRLPPPLERPDAD